MSSRPQLYQAFQSPDDLVYSSYTSESMAMIKPSEQIKSLLHGRFQNYSKNQTEPEEYPDSLNQQCKTKPIAQSKEIQIQKSIQQLKQKLHQQQQEFYSKELLLQEQLLQAQLEHDKLMRLAKQKYELIIDSLKQQLKQKDEVIYDLNLKLRVSQSSQQKSDKQIIGKHSKKSSIMTGEELDSEGACTQRTLNVPTRSSTSQQQNDDKLLSLYRHEIDKLKHQTFEFAQKFETEKRTIKDEISLLKNQKLLLQTLLTTKQSPQSERKLTKSEAKTSCKTRKQENSSIRMPKSKTRQQLRFD
ncbi:unnamed protein product [Paramecium octaurelia]|uniref:Uncharacterized protein n=1 Tax=Paramecium octaurelia TaxID=43137 RepID=A0A8S1RY95_PAROT|nr:unnamed protein product [Paramecium octaurelia]